MKKLGLILMTAVMIVGCDDNDDDFDDVGGDEDIFDEDVFDPADTENTDDPPFPPAGVYQWQANLDGRGAYDLDGGAVLRQAAGDLPFFIDVDVRGDIAGAVRPWDVRFGRCGFGGAVVGDPVLYVPLVMGPDGDASRVSRDPFASP